MIRIVSLICLFTTDLTITKMLILFSSLLCLYAILSHLWGFVSFLFFCKISWYNACTLLCGLSVFPFFKLQQILQTFQQPPKPQSPAVDNAVMAQVQAITAQLKAAPTQPPEQKTTFDKVRFSHITHHTVYVTHLGCGS